jgi:hypothetical protein
VTTPRDDPAAALVAEARPAARARGSGWLLRGATAALFAVVVGAAVVVFVLPWYVRRACIAEAAARGIALAIDNVAIEIDLSGFRLLGVRATAPDVPGAKAQASEIDVAMHGLRPQTMTVHGAELTLSDSTRGLAGELARWSAGAQGDNAGEGGARMPETVVVDGSRVVWQAPVGENARVEASGVHLTWKPVGDELHAESDHVTAALPRGALGPWRIDVDRAAGVSHVRLALEPATPDAATVRVSADRERTTSVDIAVPRSRLERLGIAPEMLGLHGKDLQLGATAHYAAQAPALAQLSTSGGLYGLEGAGLPRALDVLWDASASGDPGAGIAIDKARLAAGPLAGTAKGTFQRDDDGFRLALTWSADPVPCAAFEPSPAPGEPLGIADQLRQLAEATGIAKVKGAVSAHGTLAFDSRDLGATRLDFSPEATCQVALFAP